MPQFSANLSFLYAELSFLDRFAAAAADGFPAVEYVGPYEHPPEAVAEALADNGLSKRSSTCRPATGPGASAASAACPTGSRSSAPASATRSATAGRSAARRSTASPGSRPTGADPGELERHTRREPAFAAPRLADAGIRLLLEPINLRDIPGFFVSRTDHAERILDAVGSDNLYMQFDIYHTQVMQGDLVPTYARLADRIAHVQIADNPGRDEPGTGEINYGFVLPELDRLGYDGFVGCEYRADGRDQCRARLDEAVQVTGPLAAAVSRS